MTPSVRRFLMVLLFSCFRQNQRNPTTSSSTSIYQSLTSRWYSVKRYVANLRSRLFLTRFLTPTIRCHSFAGIPSASSFLAHTFFRCRTFDQPFFSQRHDDTFKLEPEHSPFSRVEPILDRRSRNRQEESSRSETQKASTRS